MSERDEELEALLEQLAPDPEARAQLLEEHRQLEKDLLRLADPPPPPDFLQGVMKKVRLSPAPAMSRADMGWGLAIVALALSVSVFAFSSAGGSSSGVGVTLARTLVDMRSNMVGLFSALGSVWRTSAVPLMVGVTGTLFFCSVALRQLAGRGGEARVRT
jgi:hypothetical protein